MTPSTVAAAWLSVKVGLWCTLVGSPLALGLAWVLARREFRGKPFVSALVMAPLVLPPVVTGLLLLKLLGKHGVLGPALAAGGLAVPFTFAGVVVAALCVGLPLYIFSARAAFESIDPRFEEVSRSLGRSPRHTFLSVSLPLAAPGLLAGALLAFARSLGEFGATAVLAGNLEGQTRTISLAIYTLLDSPTGDAQVTELVWVSLALAAGALVGCELVRRWSRARLGRDSHAA